MPTTPFKLCGNCGTAWGSRSDFLADKDVVTIGYQANYIALEKGLFLFNHSCQNTLSAQVHEFADLYDGPVFSESLKGSESCKGYCVHRNVLSPCPNKCECAYVRDILQKLNGPDL